MLKILHWVILFNLFIILSVFGASIENDKKDNVAEQDLENHNVIDKSYNELHFNSLNGIGPVGSINREEESFDIDSERKSNADVITNLVNKNGFGNQDKIKNNDELDDPDEIEEPVPEEDQSATVALLILCSLLLIILLISYELQRYKVKFIHESIVSIFLGFIVGFIVRLSPMPELRNMLSFDHRYFFNLLLPPILLNSGYDLKRKSFFYNIGSILTFAIVGTLISTLVIGTTIYIFTLFMNTIGAYTDFQMNYLDAIVFGAILSSTDPVTILAIFHQAQVDTKLYTIIFGESILNDSVAIVLFKVLGQFRGHDVSFFNIIRGCISFIGVFTGSILIGVLMSLICALMLKHTQVYRFPSLESSIIVLLAYFSYLLSNSVKLSGIVSLLFCGITLKHYTYNNMSTRSRKTTKYMFRVLSQLSENFVFCYLGVTVLTTSEVYMPFFILATLCTCMVARYISVVPLAQMINWFTRHVTGVTKDEIPRNHQLMLWWAGLRGAVAFALSFEFSAASDVSVSTARAVRTTTLIICLITVVMLGGTTNYALDRLKIKTGVSRSKHTSSRFSHTAIDNNAKFVGSTSVFDSDDLNDSGEMDISLNGNDKILSSKSKSGKDDGSGDEYDINLSDEESSSEEEDYNFNDDEDDTNMWFNDPIQKEHVKLNYDSKKSKNIGKDNRDFRPSSAISSRYGKGIDLNNRTNLNLSDQLNIEENRPNDILMQTIDENEMTDSFVDIPTEHTSMNINNNLNHNKRNSTISTTKSVSLWFVDFDEKWMKPLFTTNRRR